MNRLGPLTSIFKINLGPKKPTRPSLSANPSKDILESQEQKAKELGVSEKRLEVLRKHFFECVDFGMRLQAFIEANNKIVERCIHPIPNKYRGKIVIEPPGVKEGDKDIDARVIADFEANREEYIEAIKEITTLLFSKKYSEETRMNFAHLVATGQEFFWFYQSCVYLFSAWSKNKDDIGYTPYAKDAGRLAALNITIFRYLTTHVLPNSVYIESTFSSAPPGQLEKVQAEIRKFPKTLSTIGLIEMSDQEGVALLEEYFILKNPNVFGLKVFEIGEMGIDRAQFSGRAKNIFAAFFRKHLKLLEAGLSPICFEVEKLLGVEIYNEFLTEAKDRAHAPKGRGKSKLIPETRTKNPDIKFELPIPVIQEDRKMRLPSGFSYPKMEFPLDIRRPLQRGRGFSGIRENSLKGIPFSEITSVWIYQPVILSEKGEGEWKSYKKGELLSIASLADFQYKIVLAHEDIDEASVEALGNISSFSYTSIERLGQEVPRTLERILNIVPSSTELQETGNSVASTHVEVVQMKPNIVDYLFESIIEESLVVTYDAKNEVIATQLEFEGSKYRMLYRAKTGSLQILGDEQPLGEKTFDPITTEITEFLLKKGEELRKGFEQKEMENIGSNLQRAANYTEEVLLGAKGFQSEDELMHYEDKIRSLRLGDRFYGVEFIGSIYESLLRQKFETWNIHIKFLSITGGNNIRISLAIDGKSGYLGSIESTSEKPFYVLNFDEKLPEELKGNYRQTLMNMLEILGIAGKAKNHNDGMVRKKIRDAIVDPNQFNPNNQGIDQKSAERALERIADGRGKFLRAFYDADGVRQYEIISIRDDEILGDDALVILFDENLASTDQQYNKGIYRYIRNSLRLKKYLVLRVMSTILGEKYKGKDELSGSMRTIFAKIWDSMSQSEQDDFTGAIRQGSEIGANFIIGGIPFIEKLLAEYEINKVGIIYRSPKYVPLKTIRELSEKE